MKLYMIHYPHIEGVPVRWARNLTQASKERRAMVAWGKDNGMDVKFSKVIIAPVELDTTSKDSMCQFLNGLETSPAKTYRAMNKTNIRPTTRRRKK
ncbi:MAG: hypothetical protein NZ553_10765 [Caldilinea sp.]|nr:hypothetical protein [Caldilinea sp.]MDW8440944.1 hypothetical protein [Caldilineaceae bacterium]